MIPRHLLAMFVLLLVVTGCGGDDDGNTDADAAEPTSAAQASTSSDSDSDDEGDSGDDAEQEVNAEYLEGEWCSTQETDTTGTTYVFEGNTFEYGRSGSLSPGGNIPTFLIGIKVVSVEANEFIATEFGREIVFTRGACS